MKRHRHTLSNEETLSNTRTQHARLHTHSSKAQYKTNIKQSRTLARGTDEQILILDSILSLKNLASALLRFFRQQSLNDVFAYQV
jgi:hypothetical protein